MIIWKVTMWHNLMTTRLDFISDVVRDVIRAPCRQTRHTIVLLVTDSTGHGHRPVSIYVFLYNERRYKCTIYKQVLEFVSGAFPNLFDISTLRKDQQFVLYFNFTQAKAPVENPPVNTLIVLQLKEKLSCSFSYFSIPLVG